MRLAYGRGLAGGRPGHKPRTKWAFTGQTGRSSFFGLEVGHSGPLQQAYHFKPLDVGLVASLQKWTCKKKREMDLQRG